jgi:large subunit ribosomal protein L19e
MNLSNKKILAAKTLGVGTGRIELNINRLEEIKEAITRQDIKDLVKSGAIKIKEPNGRRKNVKRKQRRRIGKIKLKVKARKRSYIIITRKLRNYIKSLKAQEKITNEKYSELRKQIRNRSFKSKRHLKENLQ